MCYLVQVLRIFIYFGGEGGEGRRLRRIRCKQEKIGNVDDYMISLQAMTNDSDLNMGNNIGKRDTQFFGMFWLKTLEN